jgi:hypothetical protein
MSKPKEVLEKYFVGFDFTDKQRPKLIVGEHDGKQVVGCNLIVDKKEVEELYTRLTRKDIKTALM